LYNVETREIIEISIQIFIDTLKPYLEIMSVWVSLGKLKDVYEEFFIYVKP